MKCADCFGLIFFLSDCRCFLLNDELRPIAPPSLTCQTTVDHIRFLFYIQWKLSHFLLQIVHPTLPTPDLLGNRTPTYRRKILYFIRMYMQISSVSVGFDITINNHTKCLYSSSALIWQTAVYATSMKLRRKNDPM